MTTSVHVGRDAGGRVRVTSRADELAPRVLERTPDGARIALVATVALLLAGDAVEIEVEVEAGVRVEIVETAGTVAYDMRGGRASWSLRARVAEGGVLVWAGLPFVVSAGADVRRRTDLDLAEGATALLRETVVLGRTGEQGGDLVLSTDVRRPDGRPVLREDLDLRAAHRHDAVVLGAARCLDSLTLLGARLDEPPGPGVLELAEPGTVVRRLSADLHDADVDAIFRRVNAAAYLFPPGIFAT